MEFLTLRRRRKRGRKGGKMYIAKAMTQDAYKQGGVQKWHAVVLVGFGRKEGVEYFRYMNSHGTEFDDEGFGDLRASEIKEAFLIKIQSGMLDLKFSLQKVKYTIRQYLLDVCAKQNKPY